MPDVEDDSLKSIVHFTVGHVSRIEFNFVSKPFIVNDLFNMPEYDHTGVPVLPMSSETSRGYSSNMSFRIAM